MITCLVLVAAGSTLMPGTCPMLHTGFIKANALTSSITAQGRNAVIGHVFGDSRRPVEQLHVELMDEVDTVLATTRTDGSGRYAFNSIPSGTFQVRVLTHGTDYLSQSERIVISGFGGQNVQLDFTLRLKGDRKSRLNKAATVFAQDIPAEAQKAYEIAVRKLDRGKESEAGVKELKRAVDLFPSYYLALERLGTEYVKRQQYANAREVLTRAVEINSRGHSSLYALGIAQYNLKQMTAAIDALSRSANLAPQSVNAHLWLGIVFFKNGRPDEAETSLKRAYAIGGSRVPDVHMYLAQLYSNSKRYKDAADELELYLREASDARDKESIRKVIRQLRDKAK